jgi:hypothetical protein
MMNIRTSTESFEKWLASQTPIVRPDLIRKHERLREDPFVFLRGTFYRWVEAFADRCAPVTDCPHVLAVGDLHVENFGTWRDREGRLIWGINDLDEAADRPYTNDLVRLATSAALASREEHIALQLDEICVAILDGYSTSLERGGEPLVLEERRAWLRDVAVNDLRDPKTFWAGLEALPMAARVPPSADRALDAALPSGYRERTIRRRVAGVGSLGRQRYVAIAICDGGLIAREVKAYVPSAAARTARGRADGAAIVRDLDKRAIRAHDPFWTIDASWIVRRLAPHCTRIEIKDLPKRRDEYKLLRAMGWETANLHLATPRMRPAILRDLGGRGVRWLERAAARMVDAVVADWKEFRRGSAQAK